jgi:HSP20 family molecular chaperone IbpA
MPEKLIVRKGPASAKLIELEAQFERINRTHEKWVRSESGGVVDRGPVQIAESPEHFSMRAAVAGLHPSELEVRLEPCRAMPEKLIVRKGPASVKLIELEAQFERINRTHEKWVRSESGGVVDRGPVQIAESPEHFSMHAAVAGFHPSELEVRLESCRAMPEKSHDTPEKLIVHKGPASAKLIELEAQFERINRTHEKWVRSESGGVVDRGPVQIAESPEHFSVRAAVAGFHPSELEVRLEPRRATIAGKKISGKRQSKGRGSQGENAAGDLFRIIELPVEVDTSKAVAILKNGVLELMLPKSETSSAARVGV